MKRVLTEGNTKTNSKNITSEARPIKPPPFGPKIKARWMKEHSTKECQEKVYCSDCGNLIVVTYPPQTFRFPEHRCGSKNNILYKDNYSCREKIYKKHPRELNKKNNCKWFESEKPAIPPKEE